MVHSLKPQMIQTWMYHADLVGTLLSYWERGMGLVWNIRGSNPSIRDWPLSTRIVMRACRLLSGKPEAVIVNSEQGLLDHQAIGYRPKEWVVLHNGIDTQRFVPSQSRRTTLRKSLGLKDGDCLIGCVARFHPKKGHYFLIQSFAGLLEGADNIYLALIGRRIHEGNAELMAWIQQAGVGERVFLLGAREQSEAVYPGMDILAMPSLYGEGFPNVVAEAMSCGVPCVVSDVGDAALIVGDTGEIVAPGDVEGFSRALQQLAGTVVVKRQRLAERARDRIQSHFNLAQMLAKYDQLYRRLINPDQAH
jgi:glycosyltransferase involved in cell wall biosynthesis